MINRIRNEKLSTLVADSKTDPVTEIKQSIRRSIKQIVKSDLDLLNSADALSRNQFYKSF